MSQTNFSANHASNAPDFQSLPPQESNHGQRPDRSHNVIKKRASSTIALILLYIKNAVSSLSPLCSLRSEEEKPMQRFAPLECVSSGAPIPHSHCSLLFLHATQRRWRSPPLHLIVFVCVFYRQMERNVYFAVGLQQKYNR